MVRIKILFIQLGQGTVSFFAAAEARLALANKGGVIVYDGVVGDAATQQKVTDLLKSLFGETSITGALAVDGKVAPAAWLAGLKSFLADFTTPGADIFLDGKSVSIGGAIDDEQRRRLMELAQASFGPTFTVGSLFDRFSAAVQAATNRTLTALHGLGPSFSGEQLVHALNLAIINFETGSAEVPPDADAILQQAAAAIKAAPAGTLIEIGGHTDNTGDATTNAQLSQARAEAVRQRLIGFGVPAEKLMARGYGSERPIATNETAVGRFHNRRIEFVMLQ